MDYIVNAPAIILALLWHPGDLCSFAHTVPHLEGQPPPCLLSLYLCPCLPAPLASQLPNGISGSAQNLSASRSCPQAPEQSSSLKSSSNLFSYEIPGFRFVLLFLCVHYYLHSLCHRDLSTCLMSGPFLGLGDTSLVQEDMTSGKSWKALGAVFWMSSNQ